jgi:hypothetical protein
MLEVLDQIYVEPRFDKRRPQRLLEEPTRFGATGLQVRALPATRKRYVHRRCRRSGMKIQLPTHRVGPTAKAVFLEGGST